MSEDFESLLANALITWKPILVIKSTIGSLAQAVGVGFRVGNFVRCFYELSVNILFILVYIVGILISFSYISEEKLVDLPRHDTLHFF